MAEGLNEKRGNINFRYTLFETVQSTVDSDSNSGQKILKVASTTGFAIGDVIEIDGSGAGGGYETGTILTITAGDALNMTDNLTYTHTAVQADTVIRQGKEMDIAEGGATGDGGAEVYKLGEKIVTIKTSGITNGNGGTISLYGYVNGEKVLLHTDAITLAADVGTYRVVIGCHIDDIKAEITLFLDGVFTVKMAGRIG